MSAKLGPYPAYKDSDLESLGKVPEHWEVRRLGQFGTLSKGNGGNKGDEVPSGIPCVRYGDLYTTHTNFIWKSRSFVSEQNATNYTPLRFGDVLFAASGETIEEIGKSAVNLIQTDACCGGDIVLFRPTHRVDAQFIGYAMDCRPVAIQKSTMGRGITVKHIYGDQLKYVTLTLPPCSEQVAIVRFLDHADQRIRRYIRAKEKLIELLEEQKQAIIHQAVTGQIDVRTGQPYRAYKDSGVEWIGQVPADWKVSTLGRIAESFRTGPFGSMLHQSDYVEDGTPVINPIHMNNGSIIEDPSCSVPTDVAERLSRYRLCLHDLVFSRRGELGRCAIVRSREVGWLCGTGSIRVRVECKRIVPNYLVQIMQVRCVRECLSLSSVGATMDNLNTNILKKFPLLVPPIQQQKDIVEHISQQTATIDYAIRKSGDQISSVGHYRTRLIADVVTGKLDVRDAAVHLPEVDPIADGNRVGTIQAEANTPTTECSITNEANP